MKNIVKTILTLAALLPVLPTASYAGSTVDPNVTIMLRGVGPLLTGVESPLNNADCFGPADLIDAQTDLKIGAGVDCLQNAVPTGDGIIMTRTTFLYFQEGTAVVKGPTTVQPILDNEDYPNY